MDVINHGTQSFLITAIPVTLISNSTAGLVAGAVFGVIGMLPDIVGEYYAHFKEWNGYEYEMYGFMHNLNCFSLFEKIMLFTLTIHIFQDSFLHENGKRWWCLRERAWYEFAMWFLNIILLIIFIKIL